MRYCVNMWLLSTNGSGYICLQKCSFLSLKVSCIGAKNQTPSPYSFVIYIIMCFLPGQHTLQAR